MADNRIQWIDICKGIGIILVVLGHTLRNNVSYVYIYGFHMPLFFFLSGIVCNSKKYNWTSFLKSRFNSLIVPYLFFYLITWLYWVVVEHRFRNIDLDWWQPLIGLFYGAQWHEYMNHNGILWFLPCLFSVEILFYAISKIRYKPIQNLPVLMAFLIGYCFKFNLPWSINIACVALPFFYLGNKIRDKYLMTEGITLKRFLNTLFIALLYLFVQFYCHNQVNMATNQYGDILIFMPAALLGIFALSELSKCISDFKWVGQIIQFLGRNTLVIFALHQPLIRIFRFLCAYIVPNINVEENLCGAITLDLFVFICLIPIVIIYRAYIIKLLSKLFLQ